MRKISLTISLIVLVSCAGEPTNRTADMGTDYHVYFLGGQSNMEGFGFTSDLPAAQVNPARIVMIFNGRMEADGAAGGGVGRWARLEPGFGTGFETDGATNSLSDRFGPELAFGTRLAERAPRRNIAIIKYARGGSALAIGASGFGSWDADYSGGNQRNQYDNALTAISHALSTRDIDQDGQPDRLIPAGIIWMQGEADAYDNADAVRAYEDNLRRLMDLLRAAFRRDDLPVVLGQIADSGDNPETRVMTYSPEVQAAQKAFTDKDSCAELVTVTETFSFLPDGWHYTSDDYLTLGRAFADGVYGLELSCIR